MPCRRTCNAAPRRAAEPPGTPALVLYNRRAGNGRAASLWHLVLAELRRRFDVNVVRLGDVGWEAEVMAATRRGVRLFVAAGGDGTVNSLVNLLLRGADSSRPAASLLTVGAVGLGSSDDFHQQGSLPLGRLPGVRARIDPATARPRDVGVARYRNVVGGQRARCFLLGATAGVAARARALLEGGRPVALRAGCASGAATCAALIATFTHRNIEARFKFTSEDDVRHEFVAQVTNLSLFKTLQLAGLRCDPPVASDDGLLYVALCDGMRRSQALSMLLELQRGRHGGGPRRYDWRVRSLRVEFSSAVPLVIDGDTVLVSEVSFAVLRRHLMVCQ